MADVFVSYTREDRARVEQLAKALEGRGFEVWWDPELLPGEQYAQKISGVLAEAKSVLVVWSKASATRPWVLDEAGVGRDRGVLVPVLIEKIDAPLGFRQMQAEDLSDWPHAGGTDNFERVVRAVESLRGAPSRPGPPSAFAQRATSHHSSSRAEEPVKTGGNRLMLIGGGLVLAVLAVIAIAQIAGGGGKAITPGSVVASDGAYGLSKKELATYNGKSLIELALQRGSISAIETGARSGDATGELLMCLAYDWGKGVEADANQARTYCEQASNQGQPMATYLLHYYHQNGTGGYPVDKAAAQKLLRDAAAAGDAHAQFDLGVQYLNGQGEPQNDLTAIDYFRKAAEQGHQDAQFNIAWMYENGRGVAKDYPTALVWYQKLADENSAIGIRAVGWMHYKGWGVDRDVQKAIELYKKASDMGDGNASWNLGKLAEAGDGLPKSLDDAVAFYKKASEQGFKDADTDLKRLGISD